VNKQALTRGVELAAAELTTPGLLQVDEGAHRSPQVLFVPAGAQGAKGAEG
jgi:hypothetical protein